MKGSKQTGIQGLCAHRAPALHLTLLACCSSDADPPPSLSCLRSTLPVCVLPSEELNSCSLWFHSCSPKADGHSIAHQTTGNRVAGRSIPSLRLTASIVSLSQRCMSCEVHPLKLARPVDASGRAEFNKAQTRRRRLLPTARVIGAISRWPCHHDVNLTFPGKFRLHEVLPAFAKLELWSSPLSPHH